MSMLSDNIRLIRKHSRQTQKEFAKNFIGVTEAMQKTYELSKACPDTIYLNTLSKLANIPVNDLLYCEVSLDEILKKNMVSDSTAAFDKPADDKYLKLECLKLAVELRMADKNDNTWQPIDKAQEFFDWINKAD